MISNGPFTHTLCCASNTFLVCLLAQRRNAQRMCELNFAAAAAAAANPTITATTPVYRFLFQDNLGKPVPER